MKVAAYVLSVWLLIQVPPAVAAEAISAQAIVSPRRVPLSGRVKLTLQINGTQRAQAPALQLEHFEVRYVGPSTQITVVNGQVSTSIAHTYLLTPRQEGTFTIGPINVEVDGETHQTHPVEVEVLPASGPHGGGPPGPSAPQGVLDEVLQLHVGVDRTQAYLNQTIPIRVQLLVGEVAVRGIEMPTLKAEGFLVKPMGQPSQSDVTIGGRRYTLLEFDAVVVPIETGTLSLGPASLACQIVQREAGRQRLFADPWFDEFFGDAFFDEFFGQVRVYPVTVTAEPVAITVLPLPAEGKPEDFAGAIGHFLLDVKAVPTEVTAGEPVTVTMTVRGEGGLEFVNPPTFAGDLSRFRVYEPKHRSTDEQGALPQKAFEQVLIPLDPSVREIPAVRFSFLDPEAGRYQTLTEGPIPLTVTPAPTQEPEQPTLVTGLPEPEVLGRDIIYIKDDWGRPQPSGGAWFRSPWWWGGAVGPIGLLILSEGVRRRRLWLAADPAAARARHALKRARDRCQRARHLQQHGHVTACYEETFRALQQYIGDRFNLPAEGLTKAELEQTLGPRGVPEELRRDVEALFDRFDAIRFAPTAVTPEHVDTALKATESAIQRLEQWRGRSS